MRRRRPNRRNLPLSTRRRNTGDLRRQPSLSRTPNPGTPRLTRRRYLHHRTGTRLRRRIARLSRGTVQQKTVLTSSICQLSIENPKHKSQKLTRLALVTSIGGSCSHVGTDFTPNPEKRGCLQYKQANVFFYNQREPL